MATILVVDDERLICELLHVVLSSQGHEVLIASNGEQALGLFATRRPRLTLLDICMPGLDGPASILVVDDDEVVRDLLTDFLSSRGYRVLAAHDGPAALSLVDEQPRLVVLDIYLPGGMNGLKVLREIRAKRYGGGRDRA